MPRTAPHWIWRAAIAIVGTIVLVVGVLGWFHANAIRSEFLIPTPHLGAFDIEVVDSQAGRIELSRTEASAKPGFWGLDGGTSYAQVSTIARVSDTVVERAVRTTDGEFGSGDLARMDTDAYRGDPLSSHRIGFSDIVIPSEIGPHPGWFVDGRRSTWVLFVHGRGTDRLAESLRIIPSLVEQGFPVMVMAYRNDDEATASDSGMRTWGLEEWRDVEAAIELGERKGAQDFVVIGSGFGASIVSTYLHESDTIGLVSGAIYDSPVLDLEGVVSDWALEEGTSGVVSRVGRWLATVRFGIDWGALNQLEHAAEFDVPLLLMVGGDDPEVDPTVAEEFATVLGDGATFSRFEQAGHTDLWNADQARYEATISNWLFNLLEPE